MTKNTTTNIKDKAKELLIAGLFSNRNLKSTWKRGKIMEYSSKYVKARELIETDEPLSEYDIYMEEGLMDKEESPLKEININKNDFFNFIKDLKRAKKFVQKDSYQGWDSIRFNEGEIVGIDKFRFIIIKNKIVNDLTKFSIHRELADILGKLKKKDIKDDEINIKFFKDDMQIRFDNVTILSKNTKEYMIDYSKYRKEAFMEKYLKDEK